MSDGSTLTNARPRQIGRSIAALLAGFAVGIVLSLATDAALRAAGIFPPQGEPMWSSTLLALATAYRTLYSVMSSYVIARLAPNRPMGHALVGGFIGLAVNIAAVAATWNAGLGPHWYPISLAVVALPTAWAGGKLRVMQLPPRASAV